MGIWLLVNPLNFQNCMLWNLLCSCKRLLAARSLWLKISVCTNLVVSRWKRLSTVIDTNWLVFLSWVRNAISQKTSHSTSKYGSAESRSLLPIITITWFGLMRRTAEVNDTKCLLLETRPHWYRSKALHSMNQQCKQWTAGFFPRMFSVYLYANAKYM